MRGYFVFKHMNYKKQGVNTALGVPILMLDWVILIKCKIHPK